MQYQFGGKTYVQEQLVWGQVKQLAPILRDISFDNGMTMATIVEVLGDKLSTALAVVLTEEGTPIKGKDLNVLAETIDDSIPLEVVLQVIEDFFICNPTALILEKLTGMMESFQKKLTETAKTAETV